MFLRRAASLKGVIREAKLHVNALDNLQSLPNLVKSEGIPEPDKFKITEDNGAIIEKNKKEAKLIQEAYAREIKPVEEVVVDETMAIKLKRN